MAFHNDFECLCGSTLHLSTLSFIDDVVNELLAKEIRLTTSAVKAFCPGYFPRFASGLELKHIGARPPFGLGYHPKP